MHYEGRQYVGLVRHLVMALECRFDSTSAT
jgi:hypothetical protein